MDISKWADQAISLTNYSNELLGAIYNVKKNLENEIQPSNDVWYRGGSMDLAISFRGNTIVPESAIRPSFPRISLFVDPSITAIQKPVLKKFPDVDLGKVGLTITLLLC